MKKLITILSVFFVLIAVGNASALIYEYYEGKQSVKEGKEYTFGFDLVYDNNDEGMVTNSKLKLMNDEAVGFGNIPLTSAYVYIDLFSKDAAWEEAYIELTAWYDDTSYVLYDSVFNGDKAEGDTHLILNIDISDTSFIQDPYGEIAIQAVVKKGDGNWNNFAITEVGIGGETGNGTTPVSEPTTMLLLGVGLVGIAGLGRNKLTNK